MEFRSGLKYHVWGVLRPSFYMGLWLTLFPTACESCQWHTSITLDMYVLDRYHRTRRYRWKDVLGLETAGDRQKIRIQRDFFAKKSLDCIILLLIPNIH
ncbi:hypothetical protein G7K_3928-t1 [Saitoella complicata NRRL Y-17804]|uniref:Uncharacterized protein n=1 Tax=Saitoella complicata (strain BCRC 22490 / CBS 7301 / JCM 7358 / NBRC 10748 / NRRL Y-17804) TaxID=698492 RepID=A0A0E9NJA4_SAICN|nr:hypothetical protein G7K_3928-t1 [Saitoella complicata NRRL Y-17804]